MFCLIFDKIIVSKLDFIQNIYTSNEYGIRTRVTRLKVSYPKPLDELAISGQGEIRTHNVSNVTVLQTASFTNLDTYPYNNVFSFDITIW